MRIRRGHFAFALACASILVACSRVERAGEGGGAALMRNLLRAPAFEIVAEPGPIQDACRQAAERIARARGVPVRVLSPDDRGDPRAPRIVVGGPWNPPLVDLVRSLGVNVDWRADGTRFEYRRRSYSGVSDALVAVREDPDRPGLPLTLLFAFHRPTLARLAARMEPGWKPWVRFYRAAGLSLEGPLSTDGSILENLLVDVDSARWKELAGYAPLPEGELPPGREKALWVTVAPGIDGAARDAYLATVARARAETLRWAGPASETQRPLRLALHARPESLAACAPRAGLSWFNFARNEVHALVAPSIPDDGGAAAARSLAEDLLGPPAQSWLGDGAAVYAAGKWWGRDVWEWIAGLRLGGLAAGVASLVDPQAAETNSSHAILPLRAGLFRFLLESRGESHVRGLWEGTLELAVDAELEKSFVAWLDDLAAQNRGALEARRTPRGKSLLDTPFLAGVGIEEPDGSPRRGFGSAAYLESLREARAIGARAVSLTCFVSAERDPVGVPDPLDGECALEPFETDLRVFAGLASARESGMKTILESHLLTAPAGTLAGTGPQGDENGWRRFFDVYSRYVVHVGLLAELAEADGLVLGGGMTETTTVKVDRWETGGAELGWKQEGWSHVIRSARGAFTGTMTWAAASMQEVRDLMFWDELDVLACDLEADLDEREVTLDPKPGPEIERRMTLQLTELGDLARRHGKPLILTRAGFRSGWPRPGERRDPRAADDPGLQAFHFEALAKILRVARVEHGLRGVLLWRWSSDPSDQGVNARDVLLRKGPAREAAARALAGS